MGTWRRLTEHQHDDFLCREVQHGFQLPRNNVSFPFVQFHFNPAQSVLVVEGEDLDSINTAMTKVSYINSRQFPTPGLRWLHITTTIL